MARTPIKQRNVARERAIAEQDEFLARQADPVYAEKAFQADRVLRSRNKAVIAAVKFRKTGEGTFGEAFQHHISENLERRRNAALLKRTGYRRGVDSPEGAAVIDPNDEPFAKRRRKGATVTGLKRNTSPV